MKVQVFWPIHLTGLFPIIPSFYSISDISIKFKYVLNKNATSIYLNNIISSRKLFYSRVLQERWLMSVF